MDIIFIINKKLNKYMLNIQKYIHFFKMDNIFKINENIYINFCI